MGEPVTPRNPRAEFVALMNELYPNTTRGNPLGYAQGYADAIADVVAWLLTDGRDEMGDDAAERIKRGDANGARHG
jgi:hypothetical protein